MLRSHSYDVQLFCDFLEATVETELVHEGFDIEDVGSVMLDILFEVLTCGRQILIHKDLDQESKVLIAMETNPCQPIIEHESGCQCFFREVLWINSMMLKAIKVESALF